MADALTFGGTDLSRWLVGFTVDRPLTAEVELETIDVPGLDGVVLAGRRLRPLTIEVTATLRGETAAEVAATRRALASALATDGTSRLVLPDDPTVFYDAALSGSTALSRGYERPRCTLSFTVPDACGWSVEEHSASVSSSYPTQFEVGGNAPTWPTFTATTTKAYLGITKNGTLERYRVDGLASGGTLVVDMRTETTLFDGEERFVGSYYDYFALTPGNNSVSAFDGSDQVLKWRERWV